jgi:hypothetical protein
MPDDQNIGGMFDEEPVKKTKKTQTSQTTDDHNIGSMFDEKSGTITGTITSKKSGGPADVSNPTGESKYAAIDTPIDSQQKVLAQATPTQGIGDKLFNAASRFSSGVLTQWNPKNAFRPLYDPYGTGQDILSQMAAVRQQAAQETNPINKVIRTGLGYIPMFGPAASAFADAADKAQQTGDFGDLAEIGGNVAGAALMPSVYKNLAFTAIPSATAKIASAIPTSGRMLENFKKMKEVQNAQFEGLNQAASMESGPSTKDILQKSGKLLTVQGQNLADETAVARGKVYNLAKNAPSSDYTMEEVPNPLAGGNQPEPKNFKDNASYVAAVKQYNANQKPVIKPVPIEAPVKLQNTQPYAEQVGDALENEISSSPKAMAELGPALRELHNITGSKQTVDAQGNPTGLTTVSFPKLQLISEALSHYLAKQPGVLTSEGGYSPRMVDIIDGLKQNIDKDITASSNRWGKGIAGSKAIKDLRAATDTQAMTAAKNQNLLEFAKGGIDSPTYTKLAKDILSDPSRAEGYIQQTGDRQGLSTILLRDLVSKTVETDKETGKPIFNAKKALDTISENKDLYGKVLPPDQLEQLKDFLTTNQQSLAKTYDYPGPKFHVRKMQFAAIPAGLAAGYLGGHGMSTFGPLFSAASLATHLGEYGFSKMMSNPDMAQAFIKMGQQPGSSPISQLMSGIADESLKRASATNIPQSISRKK